MANYEINLASPQNKAEALSLNAICAPAEKGASIVTLEASTNPKNVGNSITIEVNYKFCKGCGICYSLCTKGVYSKDQFGKVVIVNAKNCVACGLCENLCPDYCIKIGG